MDSKNSDTSGNHSSSAAKIFREYGDYIYGIILWKVRSKTIADDLYQDFFLSLLSHPIPEETRNIKSYLYKAIINDIYDAQSKTIRYKEKIEQYSSEFQFSINNHCSRNASNIEEQVDEILKKSWEALSPNEAEAIILKFKQGCSIEEIAKGMDVKKESVSRYICIGLKKIKNSLKNDQRQLNE